jgi:hypothetical protein
MDPWWEHSCSDALPIPLLLLLLLPLLLTVLCQVPSKCVQDCL